ncbi:MAG: AMP-binding protein [Rhodospirillales bacterium]|nr:AMP-binding protein [Rhodospirillales bacterium]MCW8970286.1 AMP-binding protein [Rhodospirillales bacterium]MCW9001473.1 AMP-binding protein [Rhodospirillales bacterium]
MTTEFYDTLETRDPETRERDQMAALSAQIAYAKSNADYFGAILKDIDPANITSREALAALPVTRKSDLMEKQKATPPFGGLAGKPTGLVGRIFQSPGPIYEPEGADGDYWRTGRSLFASGFRRGDVVHNTFSYHLTPGGFILDCGARAVGCAVIPAGIGQTEQQLQVIADIKPNAFTGTPSFLKILLEKAEEAGADVSCFKKAVCGGEALPPSLRQQFADRGISVFQNYATADLGLIAYETPALEGMTIDEGVLVEIVRPGTGDPVAPGEVGEVVVTNLTSSDYPLIRFATGDLSAVLPGTSPCGRTNMRIKGWMGRADQTTKVKGMFVHPSQVNEVVKRHDAVTKARLVVDNKDNRDSMTLICEVAGGGNDELAAAIASDIQALCKVRGAVDFAEPGSLPNDGKVIDDIRTYE